MTITAYLLALLVAAGPSVAITFDDLPAAGTGNPDRDPALTAHDVRAMNDAILRTLRQHHVPATGFVNEKADRRDVLERWVSQGMALGNHTFSHRDYNKLSFAQFRDEVVRGEATIRALMEAAGQKLRFFRFPMNHTGDSERKKQEAAGFLRERGYELATCTIENEDYEFERAYRAALAHGDHGTMARIRTAYLQYTATEIDYYRALHRKVFGRETAQVMLLHVNRLNAEVLDAILRLFEEGEWHFVQLADAQSDPAFGTPDGPPTKFGPMWGYRWARALGVHVDGRTELEPPDWISNYK
jgi:peptidoglycan/xylan/chitin deacetylase (PgdA/CDA1 family)